MLEAKLSQTSPDGKLVYIISNTEGLTVMNNDTKTVQSKWWVTTLFTDNEKGTQNNIKGILLYKGVLYGFEPGFGVHVWELDEAGNICDGYGWSDEDESDYDQLTVRPETDQLYLRFSNTHDVFNISDIYGDRLRWTRRQTC